MGTPIDPIDPPSPGAPARDCAQWDHWLGLCGIHADNYWLGGCLFVFDYEIEILPGLCDQWYLMYSELRI